MGTGRCHGLFFALLLALAGCADAPQSRLRVGIVVWPPYEIGRLAAASNPDFASAVELVDYWSPAVAVRDFRNGSIDAVALTTNFALDLASYRDDVRIVLAVDGSNGGDALVARPDIGSFADLRGQRVGVEASALGAYVLARALMRHGLVPGDVQVVPMDLDRQEALFRAGDLAAVTTYDPVRTRLLDAGGRELFNSKELPGEIIDVLVTSDAVIQARASQLQALVSGWLAAVAVFRADPEAAALVMSERMGIAPDEFLAVLGGAATIFGAADNRRMLGPDAGLQVSLQLVHDYSVQAGLQAAGLDVSRLVDGRFVLAAPR